MAFCGFLKQSTAATVVLGPFVDSTDGVTAETALTISQADVRLSKNAAAFAQANEATSATHMENGYYSKPLSTTDTNTLGRLAVAVAESGALPVRQDYLVVTSDEWDRFHATTGAIATLGIVARGTAQAATSTTIQLATGETHADDTLIGCVVGALGSTQGYWQFRAITDYVLSTDTATVDAWTVTPSGTITYVVYAGAPGTSSERTAIAGAIRDDFIDFLQDGVTLPATSGTATMLNSAGVSQNVTVTTSGTAERITATT
jgi:hypothetical protein